MPLAVGDKLGHFEVVGPIGQGGMGEVYKARDTRLDRTVAIKVIHGLVASDPAVRERFEREARAVAALSHPHICTLHDVGSEGSVDFLVMEHLEGQSLADRLKQSRLPWDDALRYAIQIADALDAAHRRGVVHRDLKPGNVMLTPAGAKLLDFGLAKTRTDDSGIEGDSALPTAGKPLTEKGTILGTFQYMAPEQLEGREADTRTDLFSFGALLYEMVTGERAFSGKSQASLISAIMTGEPAPIASLQSMSPPGLDHVLTRCLEKDPERRWQSARDVKLELEWIGEQPVGSHQSPDGMPRWRERLGWIAALVATVAAVVALPWPARPPRDEPIRTEINLPPGLELESSFGSVPFTIAPDGSRIVYAALGDGDQSRLFVRPIDRFDATSLAGTENALNPTFSPDGHWVAYFANGKLLKVSVEGGAPIEITDAPFGSFGATWNDDGSLVFDNAFAGGGLMKVSSNGGNAERFTVVDRTGAGHFKPKSLPGNRGILLHVANDLADDWRAAIRPPDSSTVRRLPTIPMNANLLGYVSGGYLIYVLSGTLWAVPFDLDELETVGSAKIMIDGIYSGGRHAFAAISNTGTLVYAVGGVAGGTLAWVDRSGNVSMIDAAAGGYANPRLSPDGSRLMVVSGLEASILDLARGTRSRFVDPGTDSFHWSPDGGRIVYTNTEGIFEQGVDGSGEPKLVVPTRTGNPFEPSISPDGKNLVFYEMHPSTGRDIWRLPLDGGEPVPLVATEANERSPKIAPNGRWLAYVSNENGRDEVYVQSFPEPGRREIISTDGGREPVWSPDGTELFYRRGDELLVVDVDTEGEFRAGTPRALLTARFAVPTGGNNPNYDVSTNGERFVFVQRDETVPRELRVVLNWSDELERLVPRE